jgi:hypothetical protein
MINKFDRECRRNVSWPKYRYYPGIYLMGLSENTKNFSQYGRSPDGGYNSQALKHKADSGVLFGGFISYRLKRQEPIIHPYGWGT